MANDEEDLSGLTAQLEEQMRRAGVKEMVYTPSGIVKLDADPPFTSPLERDTTFGGSVMLGEESRTELLANEYDLLSRKSLEQQLRIQKLEEAIRQHSEDQDNQALYQSLDQTRESYTRYLTIRDRIDALETFVRDYLGKKAYRKYQKVLTSVLREGR